MDFDYDEWYACRDCEKIVVEHKPYAAYIYSKSGDERKRALDDTIAHVDMVSVFLERVSRALVFRGICHDWTKFDFPSLNFEQHMKYERHHLNIPGGVHDDVDLLDVLEFTCDCVSAGLQRSGEVKLGYLKVPDEVLQRAVYNTAWKLVQICALKYGEFKGVGDGD